MPSKPQTVSEDLCLVVCHVILNIIFVMFVVVALEGLKTMEAQAGPWTGIKINFVWELGTHTHRRPSDSSSNPWLLSHQGDAGHDAHC